MSRKAVPRLPAPAYRQAGLAGKRRVLLFFTSLLRFALYNSAVIPYQTRSSKITGTKFGELIKETRMFFETIESKTKRRPYVRSAYFEKRKVFFDLFWKHLYQKSFKERSKRLKFIRCAVELVEKSRNDPDSIEEKRGEIWHRFGGLTKSGELFYVQVKEDKKTRRLDFMSVFPG